MADSGTVTVIVEQRRKVSHGRGHQISCVRELAGITLHEALERLVRAGDPERLPREVSFLLPGYSINGTLVPRWEWKRRVLSPGDTLFVHEILYD